MKKALKSTAIILVLVLSAGMFSSCVALAVMTLEVVAGAVQMVGEIGGAIAEAGREIARYEDERKHAKERAKARTESYSKGGPLPFTNKAEERLTRRESTLVGGIPYDVSPYLLHGNSFAVIPTGIQPYRSVLEFIRLENEEYKFASIFEYDTAVTFDADGQKYQINAVVAVSNTSGAKAKQQIKTYFQEYTAQRVGLEPQAIKDLKVQFLKTRKGKSKKVNFQFDNVFIYPIEPSYYQFDVEVEYQKRDTTFWVFSEELAPKHFDIYNKVYRSDLQCEEAAVIDVQLLIGKEVLKKGFNKNITDAPDRRTPLPIINFVKAARYTQ